MGGWMWTSNLASATGFEVITKLCVNAFCSAVSLTWFCRKEFLQGRGFAGVRTLGTVRNETCLFNFSAGRPCFVFFPHWHLEVYVLVATAHCRLDNTITSTSISDVRLHLHKYTSVWFVEDASISTKGRTMKPRGQVLLSHHLWGQWNRETEQPSDAAISAAMVQL